jgi:hypothetical protein
MLASKQGENPWFLQVSGKNNRRFYYKKCKIVEGTWSEDGAALVRPWCEQGGEPVFMINCIFRSKCTKKREK